MHVHHVADAVLQMASLPLSANVLFTTIMASKMPFVGRGSLGLTKTPRSRHVPSRSR